MGNPSVFEKVSISEKIMDKKMVSRLSVGNLLSQIAKKERGRTFLCFRNVLVTKNSWTKWYHDFVEFFLSQSAKNFVKNPPMIEKN